MPSASASSNRPPYIDTRQKYPSQDAHFSDGNLIIILGVDEKTLHTAGGTENTLVTVSGFAPGDWYDFLDEGKYGPRVAVLKRAEPSFAYYCKEEEDEDAL